MDQITCKCASCGDKLGNVVNMWTQIGKKMITPVLFDPEDGDEILLFATATIRMGEKDTIVQGCKLQNVECRKCKASIGFKCLAAPERHIFSRGQVIFRIAAVSFRAVDDLRKSVEPIIQRILKLQKTAPAAEDESPRRADFAGTPSEQHQTPRAGFQNSDVLQTFNMIEAQRIEIQQIRSAGFQLAATVEQTVGRIGSRMDQISGGLDQHRKEGAKFGDELRSLKRAMSTLRDTCAKKTAITELEMEQKTVQSVMAANQLKMEATAKALLRFEKQMADMKAELSRMKGESSSVRAELEETKARAGESEPVNKTHSDEVSSLRREVKQLRSELSRERRSSTAVDSSAYPSHEFDILTSSLSRIGDKASQVDSLRMEFDLFRSRIQRLEQAQTSARSERAEHLLDEDELYEDPDDLPPHNAKETSITTRGSDVYDEIELVASNSAKRRITAMTASSPGALSRKRGRPGRNTNELSQQSRVSRRVTSTGYENATPSDRATTRASTRRSTGNTKILDFD